MRYLVFGTRYLAFGDSPFSQPWDSGGVPETLHVETEKLAMLRAIHGEKKQKLTTNSARR
jgi:hypothetical protein